MRSTSVFPFNITTAYAMSYIICQLTTNQGHRAWYQNTCPSFPILSLKNPTVVVLSLPTAEQSNLHQIEYILVLELYRSAPDFAPPHRIISFIISYRPMSVNFFSL